MKSSHPTQRIESQLSLICTVNTLFTSHKLCTSQKTLSQNSSEL